jgi:hypothetical protein
VSWATNPARVSWLGPPGRPPSTLIEPAVGVSSPMARLSSVVLPAPFGPTSPTTRPAVGLEHRVRVDGQLGHHLLGRRQLVARAEQPHPQRLVHLLHELQIGRDTRCLIELELDHIHHSTNRLVE